ncbi:MAG TPA: SurA N-terminal domain-containing protein [Polyangiales bacterium]|jgi:peptidyl-prolyl cis-trans isomerase SurA|nr:SurA N-terminal domain-containing protein [Polyangiales bacterium]
MFKFQRPLLSFLAAASFVLAAGSFSRARAEIIERVVATVNDDAIFLSELRRRAAPFLERVITGASEAERPQRIKRLYEQFLRELIDDQLIEQTARKMNIVVSSSDVELAIENVRKQNNLNTAQFWEAVRTQGFTEKQYRTDVRKQILRLKVTNQRVRSRVNLNDQTVRDEYDDRVRKARRRQRFHAEHIFFGIPQSASATDVADTVRRATDLRAKVDVEHFSDLAAQRGGGDLGWLEQGDLPEPLENALLALEPGQISAPVRGPSGVHIFLLRERQEGGLEIPAFEDAKDEIYRELLDRAMAKQQELFLAELRRNAVIDTRL